MSDVDKLRNLSRIQIKGQIGMAICVDSDLNVVVMIRLLEKLIRGTLVGAVLAKMSSSDADYHLFESHVDNLDENFGY